MKKSIAVLSVMTKVSIYKIISVLLLMGISQVAFVYREIIQCKNQNSFNEYSFYHYINLDILLWIFLSAFLMINIILFWTYSEKRGAHTTYFYQRIKISRNQKCVINMIYALFCYLLLCTWQVGIARLIELLVGSIAIQDGASIYQYLSGVYYAELINGIFTLNEKFVLSVGILFLILFAMEVSKAECKSKLPIGLILLFVLYAVTYKERTDNELLCIALLVVLSVWILFNFIYIIKSENNEENMS